MGMIWIKAGTAREKTKLYFWKNNSLKGQREKNSFNIEAFVAFNVILCSYKNAKKCVAGRWILDKFVLSFYTLES